jgi:hypothetical protein
MSIAATARGGWNRLPVAARVRGTQKYLDREYQQMATFNRLVVGGVVLIIGILVYNEVYDAIPTGNDTAINQTNVSDTVESAFNLAPIGLLVLVAGFILAQVMGFTSGGQ